VSEHEEQALLCAWLDFHGVGYFAVPNGARTSPSVAKRLKKEGMRAGAPDLVLVDLSAGGRPVAIEMKSANGRVSTTQMGMHVRLEAAGWVVVVGYGCGDAVGQLRALGYGKARVGLVPSGGT
jgi:hypothetical protein